MCWCDPACEEKIKGAAMTESLKPAPAPTGWKASDSPVKRAFARSRLVQVATGVLALLVLATICARAAGAAPTPFDPGSLDLMDAFTPALEPGHGLRCSDPLGADDQGRDVVPRPSCMACACPCSWACRPWRCR